MDFLVANIEAIVFYVVAALTIAGGIGVISFKNPVHSALALLGTFVMVAVLFILRHAEFLAAVQVLVYAGGIMVLYLFVIMLSRIKDLQLGAGLPVRRRPAWLSSVACSSAHWWRWVSCSEPWLSVTAVAAALQAVGDQMPGNTEAVGWVLYTKYLVPFEVVSVVLLVAMIGAIVFGRRDAELVAPGEGVES